MENIGDITIDLMGYSTRIIVDDRIIDNNELIWRNDEVNGGIELTLNEIAKQINTPNIIYVWIELGLRGEIFMYNNYSDGKWYKHGTTRGYA
jgi:hypothetical protein